MKEYGSLYGKKPLKYKIKWLQSLEVKSSSELESFKFFISKYINEISNEKLFDNWRLRVYRATFS